MTSSQERGVMSGSFRRSFAYAASRQLRCSPAPSLFWVSKVDNTVVAVTGLGSAYPGAVGL
jgi:hypothetical protein